MFVSRKISFRRLWHFTGSHMIGLFIWMTIAISFYNYVDIDWLAVPKLLLTLVGTAVAFYVGFKNNSAYDRMWEARKSWGEITQVSRSWGIFVKTYISNQFTSQPIPKEAMDALKRKLIYRHIAWLYALRSQLLVQSPWEHAFMKGRAGKEAEKLRQELGVGLVADEITEKELKEMLPENEYEALINYKNTAVHILDRQAQDLLELRERDLIEDFRHIELQKLLHELLAHQGKCERVKNFPFPRQYGGMSVIFIRIFLFLLPFGMAPDFEKLGEWGFLLAIPFSVLVGWVFVVMELVGDFSENPFEGLPNDIPTLSICRGIEIDLKEMLGEKDIPPVIEAKEGVLM